MCSTPEKSHLAGLLVFAYDICNKLDDQTCLCFDVDEQFFRWVKLATSSTVKNTRRRRTGTHGEFFSPKKLRNQIMCKVRAGDICSLWRHGQTGTGGGGQNVGGQPSYSVNILQRTCHTNYAPLWANVKFLHDQFRFKSFTTVHFYFRIQQGCFRGAGLSLVQVSRILEEGTSRGNAMS